MKLWCVTLYPCGELSEATFDVIQHTCSFSLTIRRTATQTFERNRGT